MLWALVLLLVHRARAAPSKWRPTFMPVGHNPWAENKPGPRYQHGMVSGADGSLYLFGGHTGDVFSDDLFKLDVDAGVLGEEAIATDAKATDIAESVAEVVAETAPAVGAGGFGGVLAGLAGLGLAAAGGTSVPGVLATTLSVGIYAGPLIDGNQLTIAAYGVNDEVLQAPTAVELVDGRATEIDSLSFAIAPGSCIRLSGNPRAHTCLSVNDAQILIHLSTVLKVLKVTDSGMASKKLAYGVLSSSVSRMKSAPWDIAIR